MGMQGGLQPIPKWATMLIWIGCCILFAIPAVGNFRVMMHGVHDSFTGAVAALGMLAAIGMVVLCLFALYETWKGK